MKIKANDKRFYNSGNPVYWSQRADSAWREAADRHPVASGFDGVTIDLSGPVFDFMEANAGRIGQELNAAAGADIRVDVNSPGGDIFEGVAIAARLSRYRKETGGRVVFNVLGLAASIAQYVTTMGDEVLMAEDSQMMIHRAHGLMFLAGNPDEIREQAITFSNALRKNEIKIEKAIAQRMGIPQSRVAELLAAETWYDADEAVEAKLADGILEDKQEAPQEAKTSFWDPGYNVSNEERRSGGPAVRTAYEEVIRLL